MRLCYFGAFFYLHVLAFLDLILTGKLNLVTANEMSRTKEISSKPKQQYFVKYSAAGTIEFPLAINVSFADHRVTTEYMDLFKYQTMPNAMSGIYTWLDVPLLLNRLVINFFRKYSLSSEFC